MSWLSSASPSLTCDRFLNTSQYWTDHSDDMKLCYSEVLLDFHEDYSQIHKFLNDLM